MGTYWRGHGLGGLIALSVAASTMIGIGGTSAAFADTTGYELYCAKSPVGNIVMNDVVTTGTMRPATPASGTSFTVTHYQTTFRFPTVLVSASAALGNRVMSGMATTAVDAVGATPKLVPSGTINYSVRIPKKIRPSGLAIALRRSPVKVGPFKAIGSKIMIRENRHLTLTFVVSGNTLTMVCLAYPNNTLSTGVTTTKPKGSPISPVIASS